VIVDYLKIIRANPDLPWAEHLTPQDLATLNLLILPASWYPIELFQRMGVAIFKLVSREKYSVVHLFGRSLAERMSEGNPGMVSKGRPADTVKKFLAIQARLYSCKFFEGEEAGPGRILIYVNSRREDVGTRLLVEAMSGTVKRLVELSGGTNIRIKVLEAMWEGGERNKIEVAWDE